MRELASRAAFVLAGLVAGAGALGAQDRTPPDGASRRPLASYDSAWASITRTFWDTTFLATRWRAAHDSLRATLGPEASVDDVRAAIRALIAVPALSHFVLIPESAAPLPAAEPAAGDATGEAAGAREAREARAGGTAAMAAERAGPGTAGLDVRPVEGRILVSRVEAGSPAARAGIRAGDEVTHLDTVPVARLRGVLREGGATDSAGVERLLATVVKARLGGRTGDTLRVRTLGGRGGPRPHALARIPMTGRSTRFGNLPPLVVHAEGTRDTLRARGAAPVVVARVRWSAWFPALSPSLDSLLFAARDADAMILDLRGNPGGVIGMIAGVSGHFVDSVVSLGELRTRSGTIRFAANPRRVGPGGARVTPFAGPVAILVDEFSASTTEFFASGMQALGRARVFGTRSAGQALPAAMGRLPSGDVLMHVIADHSDAAGRRVEGAGVAPDVSAPLRASELRRGQDAALGAAHAWLRTAVREGTIR